MNVDSERPQKRPANIFINYRREDSAGHSGRLFDRLGNRFPGRVFMDVDTIEPGVDFVEVIEKAVGSCEVLIVVIGREWLHLANAAGRRRLDDPEDFVRLEVATALARNIRVIPVLVEGASMPRMEDLPPDLAKLARRNAIELSDARWAFDVDRLIHTIEQVLQDQAPSAVRPVEPAPGPPAPVRDTPKPRAWMALAAAVLLVLAGWIAWRLVRTEPPRDTGQAASTEITAKDPEKAMQLSSNGECLAGNQAGSTIHSGAAFLEKCQNVSGQLWMLVAEPDGVFHLKNQLRGDGECLEGNQADNTGYGGAAFMDKCQNVTGQLWKLIPEGADQYRLKTVFRGDEECLAGNQAGSTVHGGAAFLDKCQNITGQLWKLVKQP